MLPCLAVTRTAVPAHEVLAVVLQVREGHLHVLLWRRAAAPFEGCWALPGGRLAADETQGASIARQLGEKVEVTEIAHLEQLETRSEIDRDPRGRVLATAYLGLVPAGKQFPIADDTAWHRVDQLPDMAFDHESITESGVQRLRAKLSYTNLGFAIAPATFTAAELAELYSAALGYEVQATNLRRVLTRRGQLEETGERTSSGEKGGRPAALYRFANAELTVTDPFAVLRPPGR